jgi:hypothetical protein
MAEDEDKDKIIADLKRDDAAMRRRLKEAEGKLEEATTASERAVAQARVDAAAEARKAAVAEYGAALAKAEVRALATGRFADLDDAEHSVDYTKVIRDDGSIDRDGIKGQLDDTLTRKPHYAATPAPGPAPGPTGTIDGGPRPPAPQSADDSINAMIRASRKH